MVIARTGTWRDLWVSGLVGRFVLLCLGVWLHAADTLVMATTLPAVVGDIGGVAYVAWTISFYEIGAIVAGAATAVLCRRTGIKRVLVFAALLYALGCAVAALAPTMPLLLAARLVQGLGGGALVALSSVAIQQSFPEHLWSRLFGIVAVIWGVGSLLGPLIGGVFALHGLWRAAFWCFAVQAGVLVGLSLLLLARDTPVRASIGPFPTGTVITLAAASFLIAEAGVSGHGATSVVLCLAGLGVLSMAAWADRRSSERLFPTQTLDSRHPVGAGMLMVFALSAATTGFWAYGPLLLKTLFGTGPLASGYILAGEALAWSAATVAVSSLPLAAGKMLIRLGTSAIAAGVAGFAIAVPSGSFGGMVACGLAQGFGFGLCWPSIVHRMVRFADERERVLASAAPGTVQRIGYAVGAAATGIAANASGLADGLTVSAARDAGFWVFAAFLPVLVVGLAGAWRFTARA